jgi:hypothetical protein
MGRLHDNYRCSCQVPRPLQFMGEDTGLCLGCTLVYDEQLYEMRLRQHVPNYTFDSVDDYIRSINPSYPAVI